MIPSVPAGSDHFPLSRLERPFIRQTILHLITTVAIRAFLILAVSAVLFRILPASIMPIAFPLGTISIAFGVSFF